MSTIFQLCPRQRRIQSPELLVTWLLSPLLILPVLCITYRHRDEGRNAQAVAKGQREDGGVEKAGMSTRESQIKEDLGRPACWSDRKEAEQVNGREKKCSPDLALLCGEKSARHSNSKSLCAEALARVKQTVKRRDQCAGPILDSQVDGTSEDFHHSLGGGEEAKG